MTALVAAVWISAAIFGLYIVAIYLGALVDGNLDQWNRDLPRLHDAHSLMATMGIGLHFAAGTVLLLLGPLQLISAVRARAPAFHRWVGRLYALSALMAGLGGLAFIAVQGTIGGTPMNIGFSLYGALTAIAAVATFWHARGKRFEQHRAWAIRLFALVIGSWLYRMDYGFWALLGHNMGHTPTFDGGFDVVMAFFFYIPNLIVAEAFIRARQLRSAAYVKVGAAICMGVAAAFIAVSTYYFTALHWGPRIVQRLLLTL
ncbi:hypothetical protein CWO89_42150 [Bradyrhizobium sp. Leo170]|nr:hypothetical protein CWO89_42150 [Bradyrhizobium sp. Leo170]